MSNEPSRRSFSNIFDLPFAVPVFVVLMLTLVFLPIAWNFYASGDVHHLNPMIAEIGDPQSSPIAGHV